jgi:hypothetical protein
MSANNQNNESCSGCDPVKGFFRNIKIGALIAYNDRDHLKRCGRGTIILLFITWGFMCLFASGIICFSASMILPPSYFFAHPMALVWATLRISIFEAIRFQKMLNSDSLQIRADSEDTICLCDSTDSKQKTRARWKRLHSKVFAQLAEMSLIDLHDLPPRTCTALAQAQEILLITKSFNTLHRLKAEARENDCGKAEQILEGLAFAIHQRLRESERALKATLSKSNQDGRSSSEDLPPAQKFSHSLN